MLTERLGEADAEAMRETCHALYSERVEAGLPLKPGVRELVDLLETREVARAIVTSTRRERALRKLEAVGLRHRFGTIVTGSDIAHPKPAPDIYRLAADRLGVAPEACVVIEDSIPGVRAALAAGMTPIQVPDLIAPDADARALGHRIVESLVQARALIEPVLVPR
jgi:HAD superfamily hydrolase (TIGR01509 family)